MNWPIWVLAVAVSATLLGPEAHAAQQELYRGAAWQVLLVNNFADTAEAPYCALRTTKWTAKYISVETPIRGIDDVKFGIRLHKDGWKLPVGAETKIGVASAGLGGEVTAKAVSEDDLYSEMPSSEPLEGWLMVRNALAIALTPGKPEGLSVSFGGDEPIWFSSKTSPYETHEITSAFRDCQATLRQLGPSIYKADPNAPATSPFAGSKTNGPSTMSGAGSATTPPAQAENTPWEFSEGEEDWGKTCYIGTQVGDIKVGMMGSPGDDLVGYVEGLFEGDTPATWTVNGQQSVLSTGSVNDYSGWHEFSDLGEDFLAQLAVGERLTISNLGDRRVVVSLKGAAQAVPAFMACFHKPK